MIDLSSINQIGRPILRDNSIWFNSVTGAIYSLDVTTGERLATIYTGQSARVGGALYESFYIMGDPQGKVYAYSVQ